MNTSRPSSIGNVARALTGVALLGLAGTAIAGPPPSINVQIATPGFYTSFATGPQWAPYYAYEAVPVVPVYAPPVYVPRYYGYSPPRGYWHPRHVEYGRPGWDRGWHGGDDHGHHDDHRGRGDRDHHGH